MKRREEFSQFSQSYKQEATRMKIILDNYDKHFEDLSGHTIDERLMPLMNPKFQ